MGGELRSRWVGGCGGGGAKPTPLLLAQQARGDYRQIDIYARAVLAIQWFEWAALAPQLHAMYCTCQNFS